MSTMKLKVLSKTGQTLMTCNEDTEVSLVYTAPYQPGDFIALTLDHPGQYCVVQFEDTMQPVLAYIAKPEVCFTIPMGEQAITYSPKSFTGSRHVIRARFATPEEIAQRRNLAFNCYDTHRDLGLYPHASANVETRGEAVFAARNAIDGTVAVSSHGRWPFASWGINMQDDAELTLDFGRPVDFDTIVLYTRADFPHDNWWVEGTFTFSDGSQERFNLEKSCEPHRLSIARSGITWLKLGRLIKADDPSPFPALTQIEVYGTDTAQ